MTTLFLAAPACAENWIEVPGTDWFYDNTAVRAIHSHPIERDIGASLPDDRINFIIRRAHDGAIGTLSLGCNLGQFSQWILNDDQNDDHLPVASNPLAAHLSATYCPLFETLSEAGMLPIF